MSQNLVKLSDTNRKRSKAYTITFPTSEELFYVFKRRRGTGENTIIIESIMLLDPNYFIENINPPLDYLAKAEDIRCIEIESVAGFRYKYTVTYHKLWYEDVARATESESDLSIKELARRMKALKAKYITVDKSPIARRASPVPQEPSS